MELSIIIPTLNRASSLLTTLSSIIAQQNSSGNFEVIVVDNGSTDGTKKICETIGREIENFRYCFDAEPGLLTGRHKGAELARTPLLSFIDDDVELNPLWVRSVMEAFAGHPQAAIIGGPSLPKYQRYPPEWISYFWQDTPNGGKMCLPLSLLDLGSETREVDPLYVFGLNYSIRRSAYTELKGFHPDRITDSLQKYQGDGETGLSLKAKEKKYAALYVSSALLYHLVPAERLQSAYFERWHYYSGICNSYTRIRTNNQLYHSFENPASKPHLPVQVIRKVNRIIQHMRSKDAVPKNIAELQSCFDKKFAEGFSFHQHAFNTDAQVKEWVLRPDYLNYKLPA